MSEQKRREDINTHRMHRNSHDFRLLRLSVTFCSEHPQTNRSRGRRGGQQIHHFTEDHCSFVSSIRTVLSGYSLTSLPFPFLSSERLHRFLEHNGFDLGYVDTTIKMLELQDKRRTTEGQDTSSEPPTPSSASSMTGTSFFDDAGPSTNNISETEDSEHETAPQRKLSVRDLCL